MKKLNKYIIVISMVFFMGFFSILSYTINSRAQSGEFVYNTSARFNILEYAYSSSSEQNLNYINLNLPSGDVWNLKNLQVNFTEIKFDREIFIGENFSRNYDIMSKDVAIMSIQLELTSETKIFGAYIYGQAGNTNPGDDIYFQIQGYDDQFNRPNGTIFAGKNLKLNISGDLKWYYQKFLIPPILPEGNYSLLFNNSGIQTGNTFYRWDYNNVNPIYPELYKSVLSGSTWYPSNESTFLYKLDQIKLNDFYPSDINMSVKIGDDYHPVDNIINKGEGKLNLTNINLLSDNSNPISIEVLNNQSSPLIFNVTYFSRFSKNLHSLGTSIIRTSGDYINWTLEPEIIDCSCNNSIRFDYPNNWEDLRIFRDSVDITVNCTIETNEKYLEIPDNEIKDANWEIRAATRKIDFSISFGSLTLEPLQDLQFSVNSPSIDGNLTFILYDPDGFLENQQTKSVSSEDTTFSYQIPENPLDGIHTGYIIWNNATNAGIQIQTFQITIPFTLDPMVVIIIALASMLGLAGSVSGYQVYKRVKASKERHRLKIYNKYMDILNLQYILIIDKKSGLDVYQQKFTGKEMDATLVSGFLDAMRSFGIELTNSKDQTQTIKLEFQNSKILMTEYKEFRVILIMNENPSEDFLESIRKLSLEIEKYYGDAIRQFRGGSIKEFRNIKKLVDHHLNTSLIYPLEINDNLEIKLSSEEKSIINRAKHIIKKRNVNYFFVSHLLGTKGGFPVKDAETVLSLIEKNIFQQYQNSQ
ncbi:MAG: hypothetical protein BAJALOKI3v1_280013 [Promethearchaeota archaeon]|nr:MAG: hypothetical protein BAJALOKI3v1_280013 [Candidatus Lokiarchaeota archaeon]